MIWSLKESPFVWNFHPIVVRGGRRRGGGAPNRAAPRQAKESAALTWGGGSSRRGLGLRSSAMVSFSCDACQEVKTKPKTIAHFSSCRECTTMSCIDCGETFTARTIGPHTSCISEAAKYGPRPGMSTGSGNTQAHCFDCSLALQGAVHALQHYDSKKHRATLRRKRAARAAAGKPKAGSNVAECKSADADHERLTVEADNQVAPGHGPKRISLRKAMRRALGKSHSRKLKVRELTVAVRRQLGESAPADLEARLVARSSKSPFHLSKNSSVSLVDG